MRLSLPLTSRVKIRTPLRHVAIGLGMVLLSLSCATPYEPQKTTGGFGYREIKISPTVYYLEFNGNVSTSLEHATKYWYFRASEICAPKGALPEEVMPDPLHIAALRQARSALGTKVYGNTTLTLGEPIGSGYYHSKSGFFRCRVPEPSRP